MNRIFIMLGPECNLQCKYCLQHEMVETTNTEVSNEVIDWVYKQAKKLDKKLNVTFYGGEPLVHWNAIQKAVAALEAKNANVRFSVVTNGKLLTAEKAAFFNKHNFSVGLSWDGTNVMETRGYDVINSNDNVLDLNRLCVSAVISKYTYPKDFLDAVSIFTIRYRERHAKNHGLNIDTILDFGNCGELREMDLDKVRAQMMEIMQGRNSTYRQFANMMLRKVKNISNERNTYANCGNGVKVFNVDTSGNIFRCHNCGERLGSIHDSVDTLIANAKALDRTAERYATTCGDCSVSAMCRCGCQLLSDDARNDYYCALRRAYLEPILIYAATH